MTTFTSAEQEFLDGQRLGRLATVGPEGDPHVTPVGFTRNPELGTIDIGGFDLERTKKFRDVDRSGRAAFVVDDNPSVDPWRVRGIEIRGRAEALRDGRGLIRVHPERIVAWGIETATAERRSRTAAPAD